MYKRQVLRFFVGTLGFPTVIFILNCTFDALLKLCIKLFKLLQACLLYTSVLITQLGLNVVTPVLICVLLGSWIDKKTGLHTVLIFLILGVQMCIRDSMKRDDR